MRLKRLLPDFLTLRVPTGGFTKGRPQTGRAVFAFKAATNKDPCANVELPSENANAQDLAVQ
jgi:hypothetical protein